MIRVCWTPALVLCLTAILPSVIAQAQTTDEPPIGGPRIAGEYQLETEAKPTTLAVEEPLTLTVRIIGSGPEKYQPRRQELDLFPEGMTEDFYVEPLPEKD